MKISRKNITLSISIIFILISVALAFNTDVFNFASQKYHTKWGIVTLTAVFGVGGMTGLLAILLGRLE